MLDTIELKGRLRGVKEWSDGFEELKAIEHSFVLDFGDLQDPISAYTDTPREKVSAFQNRAISTTDANVSSG